MSASGDSCDQRDLVQVRDPTAPADADIGGDQEQVIALDISKAAPSIET